MFVFPVLLRSIFYSIYNTLNFVLHHIVANKKILTNRGGNGHFFLKWSPEVVVAEEEVEAEVVVWTVLPKSRGCYTAAGNRLGYLRYVHAAGMKMFRFVVVSVLVILPFGL